MQKKTKTAPKTPKATKKTSAATTTVVPQKTKKFTMPPLFPPETTREDKLCLLSFLLGMILMASFFMIDFQVRSYIELRRWENRVLFALQNPDPSLYQDRAQRRTRQRPAAQPVKNACPPVLPRTAAFIESEYAPYGVKGDAEIKGSVCAALPAGIKCPENLSVFINPVTTYSKEWWTKHWAGKNALSPADKRANQYNVWTKADKNGMFEFDDLAAGSYYIGADACITFTPNQPCTKVRLGKQVTVKDEIKTDLDIVFQAPRQ